MTIPTAQSDGNQIDIAVLVLYWLRSLNPFSPPQWTERTISRRLIAICLGASIALLLIENAISAALARRSVNGIIPVVLVNVGGMFLIPLIVALGVSFRATHTLNYQRVFSHYALVLPVLSVVTVFFATVTDFAPAHTRSVIIALIWLIVFAVQLSWPVFISLNALAQGVNRKRRDVILWLLLAYLMVGTPGMIASNLLIHAKIL